MKPAPFTYRPVTSTAEAVDALSGPGEAAVLAGGQSLLLELRYRQRRPDVVVDINPIPELRQLGTAAGGVQVGALVRHGELEQAHFDDPLAPLLRRVARHIGHPPIRTRGTLAGSLAWAHPAAEWGALFAALDGEIVLQGPDGERTVAAPNWFRGRFRTDRRPGELITTVRLPLLGAGTAVWFSELRRTHGSFAMVAVVLAIRLGGGRIEQARIGLAGAADRPLRATGAEAVLTGQEPSAQLAAAAAAVAATEADPMPEPHCSAAYRRHAIEVLVRRGLTTASEAG